MQVANTNSEKTTDLEKTALSAATMIGQISPHMNKMQC